MGSRFDPATLRQCVARLVPGVVLRLHSARAGKEKLHVLICALHDRSLAFLINTRPAPFIQRQPERLARHLTISKSDHSFLDYDSTVACDDAVVIENVKELAQGIAEGRVEVLGRVTAEFQHAAAAASVGSKLIAQRDAELIANALCTKPKG